MKAAKMVNAVPIAHPLFDVEETNGHQHRFIRVKKLEKKNFAVLLGITEGATAVKIAVKIFEKLDGTAKKVPRQELSVIIL